MLYSAFVSYSHAADGKLAPSIQRALHTFAKPWYTLRALRVFRDKTTLSATPGLVNPASWRDRACQVANRNLTFDEWTQFLGEEPYRPTCPSLPIDPTMIEAGRRRARSGDIDGATAIFQRVRELAPGLQLDPRSEAIRFSVEDLVEHGKYLAGSGDVEGGTLSFERAKKLDPALSLNPRSEARKLAAPWLMPTVGRQAQQGLIAEALAAFALARAVRPHPRGTSGDFRHAVLEWELARARRRGVGRLRTCRRGQS